MLVSFHHVWRQCNTNLCIRNSQKEILIIGWIVNAAIGAILHCNNRGGKRGAAKRCSYKKCNTTSDRPHLGKDRKENGWRLSH